MAGSSNTEFQEKNATLSNNTLPSIDSPSSTPFSNDPDSHPNTSVDHNSTPIGSEVPLERNTYEDSVDPEVGNETIGVKRKLTSSVWNHFKKQQIDGVDKAVCNYCKKKLGGNSKNGTKHLHDHLERCPLRKQRDIKQALLNPKVAKNGGKTTLSTYTFDPDISRRQLACMIILHEYPLAIVDHEGFRNFCHSLQPLFKMISRNTIKNDIFKIFEIEKSKQIKLLENINSRVAITTDMWTANNQKRQYMVVTAHFIDQNWVLQSRIIRFQYVPCPHTAEVLGAVLMECFIDWNLDRKLSTLTVDNCSTNDSMIKVMKEKLAEEDLILGGEFFHMRCVAHILNLIVKDGLKVIEVGIERIRESVAFWTATPKRIEKFEESVRHLKIPYTKRLALDVKTRWNSTYIMLHSALLYKNVFNRLKQHYKFIPLEEDWTLAKEMCERLKKFYTMTELVSGTKYPTANIFFPQICEMKLALFEWEKSHEEIVRNMASVMIEKFEKYWNIIHGVISVATVLDPRYKMKLLEYYFPKIYGRDGATIEIERVRLVLSNMIKEYQVNNNTSNDGLYCDGTFCGATCDLGSSEIDVDPLLNFDVYVTNTTIVENIKSELEIYLEEGLLPRTSDFDILTWWKSNGVKYQTLQRIARDVFAIPISTVASESAFSTGGRFVSPHRNRLNPKTLEALMCSQDWLWSELKDPATSGTGTFGLHTIYASDSDEDLVLESCISEV